MTQFEASEVKEMILRRVIDITGNQNPTYRQQAECIFTATGCEVSYFTVQKMHLRSTGLADNVIAILSRFLQIAPSRFKRARPRAAMRSGGYAKQVDKFNNVLARKFITQRGVQHDF